MDKAGKPYDLLITNAVDRKYRALLDLFNEKQFEPDVTTLTALLVMTVQVTKIQKLPLSHVLGALKQSWDTVLVDGPLIMEVKGDGN